MHLSLLGLDSDLSLFDTFLSDRLAGPIGDDLGKPGYKLADRAGQPVKCRICGCDDGWLPEGAVFVCEHDPIDGVPCRVLDSVKVGEVLLVQR